MNQALVVTYGNVNLPDDPYWLTVEQQGTDATATVEDVAAVVDALYHTDPCVQPVAEAVPKDEPTEEELLAAAHAIDLDLCKLLQSGKYEAEVKLIRSHPELPYKFILSLGKVDQTVVQQEYVTLTLDVKEATSSLLTYPVISALSASWLGTVYTAAGAVAVPPVINARHNTLFWDTPVTGTIRVRFNTLYDLLTLTIPGKKAKETDLKGEALSSNILVFYHYQTYTGTVDPPAADSTADQILMARVCGWQDVKLDLHDEDKPLAEPPPPPENPCIDQAEQHTSAYRTLYLADPKYYQDTCCKDPSYPLPTCRRLITGRVSTREPDQATKDSYNDIGRPVKFLAVGPDPLNPSGCGRVIREIDDSDRSCCVASPPVVWDAEHSVSVMSDYSSGTIFFSGGFAPFVVKVSGTGFWVDPVYQAKGKRTNNRYCTLYTANGCGTCEITVTDYCGNVCTGFVSSTDGVWSVVEEVANTINYPVGGQGYVYYEPQWCYTTSVLGRYKVQKGTLSIQSSIPGVQGVVPPVFFPCQNQYVRPGCGNVYAMTNNRPTYGHDPGSCTPDIFGSCSDYWVNYAMQYCVASMTFPGLTWKIWEWRC